VEAEGARRGLKVIDAACPLVTKVHQHAQRFHSAGAELILIGHQGHPEVEGTRGRVDGKVHVLSTVAEVESLQVENTDQLAYVTQTTLSIDDTRDVIDALVARFPKISGPDLKDICYATQNRQNAVKRLVGEVDLLIVVGSQNSSNSNRLRELGERAGVESHLVDDPAQIQEAWLTGKLSVGVTAGASAPEILVERILARLAQSGVDAVHEVEGERETITFKMPDELLEGTR